MYPGIVLVFEPALCVFRVFFTGGSSDPGRWIHGEFDGWKSFGTPPSTAYRLARGIYAI